LLESQPVLSGIKAHDLSPKASEHFGALPLFSPSGEETKEVLTSSALARAENQSFSSGELRSNSFRLEQKVPF
jgi:hypothetical protein